MCLTTLQDSAPLPLARTTVPPSFHALFNSARGESVPTVVAAGKTSTSTLVALVLAFLFTSATTFAAETIVAVSYGGSFAKSQIEAYHKPFQAKTGIVIVDESFVGGGLGQIRAQVESENVRWDILTLNPSDAIAACDEGLLERIDPAILPPSADGSIPSDDFLPNALGPCWVGSVVYSAIFTYDTSRFPEVKPTKLEDFFDLKKFPGRRGLTKNPYPNLEWALLSDGVAPDEVYSLLRTTRGIERAFRKLDTIKDHIVWWELGAQPAQLLADGEVVMTQGWNGRMFNAIVNENKPFAIVWDHQIWDMGVWSVVKGTRKLDTAMDFISFASQPVRIAEQSRYIPYGPARRSAFSLVSTHIEHNVDMKPHLPTAPENFATALLRDVKFWGNHQEELNEKFFTWLSR